ncbi:MAG: nucleotide exchange factor GrpE [Chloroflexi bacterium]|nr:nucleotide exchange factor GrpE [Chloroflexota bacterium]
MMTNEGQTGRFQSENAGSEDIETLEKALAEEKAKAEANLAGWQRAQADFINYKRRSEQEREETVKLASAGLILCLLPILDDFERAAHAFPLQHAEGSWAEGFRLIERKLKSALEAQGLCAIEAVGEPFDPRLHEAVNQDKGKEGIIVRELEKGYKLYDRVLRPAKVVVGNGEKPMNEKSGG